MSAANIEAGERLLLRLRLPSEPRREAVRRVDLVEHALHGGGRRAQVLAGRDVGRDVDDALQVLALDDHRPGSALDARQGVDGHHAAFGSADEDVGQVRRTGAVRIVEAHVDVVLVARLLVGEGHRRETGVADQAGEHGLRDLLLGHAQGARLLAIHDHVELGVVLFAADLHVGEQRATIDVTRAA